MRKTNVWNVTCLSVGALCPCFGACSFMLNLTSVFFLLLGFSLYVHVLLNYPLGLHAFGEPWLSCVGCGWRWSAGFLEPDAWNPHCSFNNGTETRSAFISVLSGRFVQTTLKRQNNCLVMLPRFGAVPGLGSFVFSGPGTPGTIHSEL